ncbi:fucosyltransferase [Bathycoccus prasinos]|uniref:O-fucosyltransferase family protein n=1 Tax=Bathycoccus prasinos TaxID=41875 RepID=K8ER86_9CHLO|nr:fucosyltransferase [Bathycoccus prasinos]CCO20762.1 fucosyltransferase [Bathycoccus prasinos]|eukprot:XP_007508043.1 fucosyltransferase [Bathycoccus prasinos]
MVQHVGSVTIQGRIKRRNLYLITLVLSLFLYIKVRHTDDRCSEKKAYAQIIATGGINNQIISAVNALLLVKYLNITVLLPLFSVQTGSKYATISLTEYFDEKHFNVVLKELGISLSVRPPSNCKEKTVLQKSSGRKFKEIITDLSAMRSNNANCQLIEIENQWGIRELDQDFNGYMKLFEAFKVRSSLYKIYENYKKELIAHPFIAIHARVEKSWPTLYFNSHEDIGIKDEIAGMVSHLKKINMKGVRNIFILSGRDCVAEIFDPLRSAGYVLQCLDSRTATFNHTGEVGRESYQKALVDSLIAFDADYFIGRYASSASYLLKIKRREKNVSMYCANSGFMCSDCGRTCLKHRGVKRHYKSIRDMENCFFMPGCGTEICRDRVDNSQKYTCQKENLSKKTSISRSCRINQHYLIQNEGGFKHWYTQCKAGRNECGDALLRNC